MLALRVGVVDVELGEDVGWGDGEFGDEVLGDVGGGAGWSCCFGAAEFPAVEVEAVAEEAEHLLEVALDGADDVFSEQGLSTAMFAEHAANGLGLVEETAGFFEEGALAAEVDGTLSAVLAPGEAVVGAKASAAVSAPSFGDGALGSEAEGILAKEGEGFVVLLGYGHMYMYSRLAGFLNRKTEHPGDLFWGGWGFPRESAWDYSIDGTGGIEGIRLGGQRAMLV